MDKYRIYLKLLTARDRRIRDFWILYAKRGGFSEGVFFVQ